MALSDHERVIPMDMITQRLSEIDGKKGAIASLAVVDVFGLFVTGTESIKTDLKGNKVADSKANNFVKAYLCSPPALIVNYSRSSTTDIASNVLSCAVTKGAFVIAIKQEQGSILDAFAKKQPGQITIVYLEDMSADKKIALSIQCTTCAITYFEIHPFYNTYCYVEFVSFSENTIETFKSPVSVAAAPAAGGIYTTTFSPDGIK